MKSLNIKWNIFWWFEWSIKYKDSKYAKMYSQEEAFNLIWQLEKCDILITHNPPFWVQDNKDPFINKKTYKDLSFSYLIYLKTSGISSLSHTFFEKVLYQSMIES